MVSYLILVCSQNTGADFVCEPDEHARLVEEFKAAGVIGDNRKGVFKHKNTFTGESFVTFLTKDSSAVGRFSNIFTILGCSLRS